jgi:hypothetical protein
MLRSYRTEERELISCRAVRVYNNRSFVRKRLEWIVVFRKL